MKRYEVMYIADPANEEGIDEVKKKIEGIITGREGTIVSYEKLGKKRLAYTIAKRQYGVYFLIDFKGGPKIVNALDYFLRMNPVVIRSIVLAFSDKDLRLKEETERIQLEEAERMRQGGRPLTGGAPRAGDEPVVVGSGIVEPSVLLAPDAVPEETKVVESVEVPPLVVEEPKAEDAPEVHEEKAE